MAAVRMALSVDDICDAQIEVEAYHRLQQLQGKHVPRLLGYGQSGQGFCVVTSYIQVCQMHCWLAVMPRVATSWHPTDIVDHACMTYKGFGGLTPIRC